jgi:1,4-alpha-glucan branching enzyme
MLMKNFSRTGKYCRVTFKLPRDTVAEKAFLCADFNNWDTKANPMKQLKNGGFSTTVSLPTGKTYRFRYLLNDQDWENDWKADSYIRNDFGTDDSVLDLK